MARAFHFWAGNPKTIDEVNALADADGALYLINGGALRIKAAGSGSVTTIGAAPSTALFLDGGNEGTQADKNWQAVSNVLVSKFLMQIQSASGCRKTKAHGWCVNPTRNAVDGGRRSEGNHI